MSRPKKGKPIKIVTLDTETYGLGGALKRIAIYDGKEIIYGYKYCDVEPYLEKWSYDFNVHVYIHNIEFDARKLEGLFERGNILWSHTKIINKKYAVIAAVDYTLHDSFKILPKSLDYISQSFKVEHAKLDLWEQVQKRYSGQYKDKVDYFVRCDKDDPLYVEYLGYDVMSLYEVVQKLIEISGIPIEDFVKRISTASLSKYILRKGFKGQVFRAENAEKTDYEMLTKFKGWGSKKKIPGEQITYLDLENKIRASYCGGRTEVFKNRMGAGFHYDVNSLYPSVMINNEFPVGFPEWKKTENDARDCFTSWMENHRGLGFLRCAVFVPDQVIPPLPCKMGKLAFVCGHIAGSWTFNELEYAILNCGVVIENFYEAIYFRETYKVFHNFISVFAGIKSNEKAKPKEERDTALIEFTKLIQNTSYGWTVLNRDDKTELQDIDKIDKYRDNGRLLDADQELGCIEVKAIVTGDSIQPQVGAYVTSYARIVLLDQMIKQSKKGYVFYCDTDSIFCEKSMSAEFVDKAKLGFWDCEHEIVQAIFIQPKVYCLISKDGEVNVKFKGVTHETQKRFDFKFYEKIFSNFVKTEQGENIKDMKVEKRRERLSSLRVAQKKHKDPNELTMIDKTIHFHSSTKRKFSFTNNESKAWYMNSIDEFANFSFKENYDLQRNKTGDLINCV